MDSPDYFSKGFGLAGAVRDQLVGDYHSDLVEGLRIRGHRYSAGPSERATTIRLAYEFGFCYGVERAVDYAYQTRQRFPDRAVFITGEIIHNPGVNDRLVAMGIRFLDGYGGASWKLDDIRGEDVVILPAFGVPVETMAAIRRSGSVLVDATCGSVLNVWKNVERYARDGFTSVIHGKFSHEETRATASRATSNSGHYIVVRDIEETGRLCREIEGPSDPEEFLARLRPAVSSGFDPRKDLDRIGVANQTTMLSSESLEIAAMLRRSMARGWGEVQAAARFRSFDTICSATQDRQDAVRNLIGEGVDLMVVIGGYNSSNTSHLTEIAAASSPTYHIQGSDCLTDARSIRHLPVGGRREETVENWLPLDGALTVGITAGASTPNSEVGRVIARLLELRGTGPEEIAALAGVNPPRC